MNPWTDERVEKLTKLWAEGRSAGAISDQFGGIFTRNAIIGKTHRLGLQRNKDKRRPYRRAPVRKRKPASTRAGKSAGVKSTPPSDEAPAGSLPPIDKKKERSKDGGSLASSRTYRYEDGNKSADIPIPDRELIIPVGERASILSLRASMCRWPIGEPGDSDFHFCGRESEAGMPYCGFHCHRAYQPRRAQRRDSASKERQRHHTNMKIARAKSEMA